MVLMAVATDGRLTTRPFQRRRQPVNSAHIVAGSIDASICPRLRLRSREHQKPKQSRCSIQLLSKWKPMSATSTRGRRPGFRSIRDFALPESELPESTHRDLLPGMMLDSAPPGLAKLAKLAIIGCGVEDP